MTEAEVKTEAGTFTRDYNVIDVLDLIAQYCERIKECKGKTVAAIFGVTQAGKSTTINALAYGPLTVKKRVRDQVEYSCPRYVPVELQSKMGTGRTGCTKAPECFALGGLGDEVILLDTRGVFDDRYINEMIASSILTQIALDGAREVKLVFLQQSRSFFGGHVGMMPFSTMFGDFVKSDNINALFLFNNYTEAVDGVGGQKYVDIMDEFTEQMAQTKAERDKQVDEAIERIVKIFEVIKEVLLFTVEYQFIKDLADILMALLESKEDKKEYVKVKTFFINLQTVLSTIQENRIREEEENAKYASNRKKGKPNIKSLYKKVYAEINDTNLSLFKSKKRKEPLTTFDLTQKILNKKYKIAIDTEYAYENDSDYSGNSESSYYCPVPDDIDKYLINECIKEDINLNIIKYLIEVGADVNKEDKNNLTPLFYACESGNEAVVKYLVDHGADVNKKRKYLRETPLFPACKHGNEAIVNYLVEHGADVYERNCIGLMPIFFACKSGKEAIVKCLIEHGVDVNKKRESIFRISGDTPLFYACRNGNEALVRYLVEHGAEVDKENYSGETPLCKACLSGNEAVVKYLVEHGADINNINNQKINKKAFVLEVMPIVNAIKSGNVAIVKYLIEKGAKLYSELGGKSILKNACSIGNIAMVKILIEHGIDINEVDTYGRNQLFYACISGNEALVKYFVENGVDINSEDMFGETPLFHACQIKNISMVKYLIEHGANINVNSLGRNPLHLAIGKENESESLVKYLVEHEANININKADRFGETPLMMARKCRNVAVINYLVAHGAKN